ncbi:hypothetical protein DFJ74DRAFT_766596 [Hyaloraphidium curvatum]|nr:hypothetical protein DFJ74DRAFT_766596 [Hyaloraphidium curvatum]
MADPQPLNVVFTVAPGGNGVLEGLFGALGGGDAGDAGGAAGVAGAVLGAFGAVAGGDLLGLLPGMPGIAAPPATLPAEPCSAFLPGGGRGARVTAAGLPAHTKALSAPPERRPAARRLLSPLLCMPDELVTHVAAFVDAPANLFRTCRALHRLSRRTSLRVEFLAARGIDAAGDSAAAFLRIVSPDVLAGLFARAPAMAPVPRYQLQILQRHLLSAGRADLLPALLAYHGRTYPSPAPALREQWAVPYGGTSAAVTDAELFGVLLGSHRVPEGCESLVIEGMDGGWAVEEDSVLTALLTLQSKYRLPASFAQPGFSPLSKSLSNLSLRPTAALPLAPGNPNIIDTFPFAGDRACDVRRDANVPGTDEPHALLVRKAHEGDAVACSRLAALGVRAARLPDPLYARAAAEGLLSQTEVARNALANPAAAAEFLLSTDATKPAGQLTAAGVEAGLCSRYGVRVRDRAHEDAVAAAAAAGRVEALRVLLDSENAYGRWETGEGKALLKKLLQACKSNTETYNLVKSYCGVGISEDKSVALLASFLAADEQAIRNQVAAGAKLTTAQFAAAMRSPSARPALPLLFSLCPLDATALEQVLKLVLPASAALAIFGNDPNPADPALVAAVSGLLAHYEAHWRRPAGRRVLNRLFERAGEAWRTVLRPFMGTPEECGVASTAAKWDLRRAVRAGDVEAVADLHARGVRVYLDPELFGAQRPPAVAHEDALVALWDLAAREAHPADRTRFLGEAVYMMADRTAMHALRNGAAPDEGMLLECVRRGDEGGGELFAAALEAARAGRHALTLEAAHAAIVSAGGWWAEKWGEYRSAVDADGEEGA